MSASNYWHKVTGYFAKIRKKKPVRISRQDHTLNQAHISSNTMKVLRMLQAEGYQAYLVGGGVRDLLLGRKPKDFDVATDALPHEVRQCFRNSRIIGQRFKLVHVYFRREIIEVSTFRAQQAAPTISPPKNSRDRSCFPAGKNGSP